MLEGVQGLQRIFFIHARRVLSRFACDGKALCFRLRIFVQVKIRDKRRIGRSENVTRKVTRGRRSGTRLNSVRLYTIWNSNVLWLVAHGRKAGICLSAENSVLQIVAHERWVEKSSVSLPFHREKSHAYNFSCGLMSGSLRVWHLWSLLIVAVRIRGSTDNQPATIVFNSSTIVWRPIGSRNGRTE